MKAMVLHNWVDAWGKNLQLESVPIPQLEPGEVLVKVRACGVGLTVSNFMRGAIGRDPKLLPKIPGDEIAGDVAEIADGVREFRVGERVLVYLFVTCGHCKFCLRGKQDFCLNFGGWIGRHLNGGYAEYVKVPATCLFKLPDEIPYVEATAINTAIASAVHVVRSRAHVTPGDDVMILGAAGGVGIHLIQMVRLFGGRTIAVDIDDAKLERTKEYGADKIINASQVVLPEEVKRLTLGKGVEVAVDLVGTPKTLVDCVNSLARGGTLVNLTSHPGVKFEVEAAKLPIMELVITGSRYTTKHEFLEAIELVKVGRIRPVVTKTAKLEEVESLHVMLAENRLFGRAAVVY